MVRKQNMNNIVYTINEFLNDEEMARLHDLVLSEKENFKATTTMTNADNYRKSSALQWDHYPRALFDFFRDKIHALIPQVCDILLHPEFEIDQEGFESQITCSSDRDFYKTHNDSGSVEVSRREITYVYYFNFEPKRFRGGELQVYTNDFNDPSLEIPDEDSFFVAPVNNSIVFFDSRRKHQVLPVRTRSPAFEDSRFTVNGWVKRLEH